MSAQRTTPQRICRTAILASLVLSAQLTVGGHDSGCTVGVGLCSGAGRAGRVVARQRAGHERRRNARHVEAGHDGRGGSGRPGLPVRWCRRLRRCRSWLRSGPDDARSVGQHRPGDEHRRSTCDQQRQRRGSGAGGSTRVQSEEQHSRPDRGGRTTWIRGVHRRRLNRSPRCADSVECWMASPRRRAGHRSGTGRAVRRWRARDAPSADGLRGCGHAGSRRARHIRPCTVLQHVELRWTD